VKKKLVADYILNAQLCNSHKKWQHAPQAVKKVLGLMTWKRLTHTFDILHGSEPIAQKLSSDD